MKINSREKILIVLLAFSMVVGIIGCIVLDHVGREQCDEYLQMTGKDKGKEIDETLNGISARIDVVASDIRSEVNRSADPFYDVFIRRVSSSTSNLLMQILDDYDGHAFAYIRFNEDFEVPDEGCFYERTDKNVINHSLTDISQYDHDDIEHVGWYYIPAEYGAAMWMEPYLNKNVDTYMISYVVPVFYEGGLYCIVGMDIDLTEMIGDIESFDIYDSGYALLYDKVGNVLNQGHHELSETDVTSGCRLINGMSLVIYAPREEVYPMHYSMEFGLLTGFYVVMLIVTLFFILFSAKLSPDEDIRIHVNRNYAVLFLRTLITLLLAAQIGLILHEKGIFNRDQYYILQDRTYEEKLRAAAPEDFEPYSYAGEDSHPTGHDIELANALANELDVSIEVELMDEEAAIEAVKKGEADMVLGIDSVISKTEQELMSGVARTGTVATDAFVIYGKKHVRSIADLQDANIAAVENDSYPDVYNLRENATLYESADNALRSLIDGSNDYAIVRRSVGSMLIARKRYDTLIQVYELMESQMCIGVNENNALLLRRLNAGIIELDSAGTLSLLSRKWLEAYTDNRSVNAIVRNNADFYVLSAVLIILCVFISLILNYSEKKRVLTELSDMDALTSINNRGAGERKIRKYLSEGREGMFMLFDVDKFKSVNDNFGHAAGDAVLIAIAGCLKSSYRDDDVVMRHGGDEYAAYLVDVMDEKTGGRRIQRLFDAIEAIDLPELDGRRITVSLGAVINDAAHDADFDMLYAAADQGAYESKKTTGNSYSFSVLGDAEDETKAL